MSNMSDWLENGLVDLLFRGQAITLPASLFISLYTANPTDAGGGTEVTGGSYARVAVVRALANFAGTQSAGSTVASSGAGGQTSNNGTITFPAPTANWGTITGLAIHDAISAGNPLFWMPLTLSKAVNSGDQAPIISAGALTVTLA